MEPQPDIEDAVSQLVPLGGGLGFTDEQYYIALGTSYALRPVDVDANDVKPSVEVLSLRSQVASLEAALYRAEMEACPSLGVHPVSPAAKAVRR